MAIQLLTQDGHWNFDAQRQQCGQTDVIRFRGCLNRDTDYLSAVPEVTKFGKYFNDCFATNYMIEGLVQC